MRIPSFLRPPRDSRSRYLFLLIWLIAYLLADAIAFELGGTTRVVDLLFAGVLVATLRVLSRNPREFAVATSMGLAIVASSWRRSARPSRPWPRGPLWRLPSAGFYPL
jgi:hypothetical protein